MPEHPDCLRVPDQLKEVQMDKKKPESAAMRAKSAVEDAFGLPPLTRPPTAGANRQGIQTCRMEASQRPMATSR
jgi:hypothetical protein